MLSHVDRIKADLFDLQQRLDQCSDSSIRKLIQVWIEAKKELLAKHLEEEAKKEAGGETKVDMAKIYIPKVNDVVLMNGQGDVRYVVIRVDEEAKRADVRTVSDPMTLHRNVPWPELYEPDATKKDS